MHFDKLFTLKGEKMKRVLSILLIMLLAFALVSCGGSKDDSSSSSSSSNNSSSSSSSSSSSNATSNATSEGKNPADIQLAGLVFSDDQFMNALLRGYETAANEWGVKINLQNVSGDAAREAELINTFIEQGYDGIAIAPLNKDGSVPALKVASERGMLVATTNMDLRGGEAGFIIGGFTSDDFENGYAMGTYAAKYAKENIDGTVYLGIIHFDHSLPDQSGARWGGFIKGLEDGGITYEIVTEQANAQGDPLGTVSGQITAAPNMNMFFACNEGSTIGAAMAVEAAGKIGVIPVFGYDSSDQTSAMILDPDTALIGVVTQDPYTMGYGAVTLLCQALVEGKDMKDTAGTTATCPGEVLTKDNPDGVKAWRTSNGLSN